MQLFQQNHINLYLAKFKNEKLETQFLSSLEKKQKCDYEFIKNSFFYYQQRQIPIYLVLLAELIWAAMRLIMGDDQQNELQTLLVVIGLIIIFRFIPSRFQKTTYQIIMLATSMIRVLFKLTFRMEWQNILNQNQHLTYSLLQIQMQVVYYILESQNFVLEIICMLTNFSIIIYYMNMPMAYLEVYIMTFLILIICKHYQNVNQRRLFLSLKNFQELEKINDLALSNILFIQQFNKRTYEMKLVDCNEKAKKLNIHKSQELYNNFLQSLNIHDFKHSSSMLISKKQVKKLETLKDVLLVQHAQVYEDMVKKNEQRQQRKQSQKKKDSTDEESLHLLNGDLKVNWTDQSSNKKHRFNVKIVPIFINEPLILVFLEDITIYTQFTNLKATKDNEFQLQQSAMSFLSDKLQEIMLVGQISIQEIKRKLICIKQSLNFLKKFEISQVQIEEFSLQTIINQVQKLYDDFPQIKYINEVTNDQMKSNRHMLFSIILGILSSIKNPQEIRQVITKPSQNKFSQAIKLEIIIDQADQNASKFKEYLNFYNSSNYSLFFEAYTNYFKNIMQRICLNNYYSIETDSENNTFSISIEILQDLQILHEQVNFDQIEYKNTQQQIESNHMISHQSFILQSQQQTKRADTTQQSIPQTIHNFPIVKSLKQIQEEYLTNSKESLCTKTIIHKNTNNLNNLNLRSAILN